MFVDFFIRRPIFATVCALLIILAGAVTIPTLPVAQFPDLAPPQVGVGAFYNGANARAVETSVTTPLEQAINGVEGMKYMTSSSGNDGSSGISITFDISRNIDLAEFPNVKRWLDEIGARPAVKKAMAAGPEYREDPATVTPEEQALHSARQAFSLLQGGVDCRGLRQLVATR